MFTTGLESLLEKVAAAMPAAPGLLSRMGRTAKRGLGATALLGAGALGVGALHQNENDAQQQRQIFTPMTGSIYG